MAAQKQWQQWGAAPTHPEQNPIAVPQIVLPASAVLKAAVACTPCVNEYMYEASLSSQKKAE